MIEAKIIDGKKQFYLKGKRKQTAFLREKIQKAVDSGDWYNSSTDEIWKLIFHYTFEHKLNKLIEEKKLPDGTQFALQVVHENNLETSLNKIKKSLRPNQNITLVVCARHYYVINIIKEKNGTIYCVILDSIYSGITEPFIFEDKLIDMVVDIFNAPPLYIASEKRQVVDYGCKFFAAKDKKLLLEVSVAYGNTSELIKAIQLCNEDVKSRYNAVRENMQNKLIKAKEELLESLKIDYVKEFLKINDDDIRVIASCTEDNSIILRDVIDKYEIIIMDVIRQYDQAEQSLMKHFESKDQIIYRKMSDESEKENFLIEHAKIASDCYKDCYSRYKDVKTRHDERLKEFDKAAIYSELEEELTNLNNAEELYLNKGKIHYFSLSNACPQTFQSRSGFGGAIERRDHHEQGSPAYKLLDISVSKIAKWVKANAEGKMQNQFVDISIAKWEERLKQMVQNNYGEGGGIAQ